MAVWLIIITIIIITIFFLLYCPRTAPRFELFFGCEGQSGLFLHSVFPWRVSPQQGLPLGHLAWHIWGVLVFTTDQRRWSCAGDSCLTQLSHSSMPDRSLGTGVSVRQLAHCCFHRSSSYSVESWWPKAFLNTRVPEY